MTDTMNQTPVTWDTGASAQPGPAMVVNPERAIGAADLAHVAAGSGLNATFLADLISSCAAHERLGLNLYKALEAQTNNPAAKHRFAQFQTDALEATAAYETLMGALGIPTHYTSPTTRLTDAIDTSIVSAFLLAGSADQMTVELKGVEAVLLASTLCIANTSLLRSIAEGLEESDVKTAMDAAVAVLDPAAQSHLEWAAHTQHEMVLGQAQSSLMQKVGEAAEAVVGKVRDVLGR